MFKVVKEIRSRQGVLHFRRRLLLKTPWFEVYLHNILASDLDLHPHNHPWTFVGLILSGSYEDGVRRVHPGSFFKMSRSEYHKLKLLSKEVWSICFASTNRHPWGYLTEKGHIDHVEYRQKRRRNEWSVNG